MTTSCYTTGKDPDIVQSYVYATDTIDRKIKFRFPSSLKKYTVLRMYGFLQVNNDLTTNIRSYKGGVIVHSPLNYITYGDGSGVVLDTK